VDRLTVLASWTPSDEAAELLTVDNMSELIALLRERFDFVLIDTPPILPYSDGRVLSTLAEGVILVARSASTPRSAINRTMELLSEVRSAPILSVVLNGADYTCADYRYCYGYR
jgi:Mrp family chromosome partitioning ATPase